MQIKTKQRVAQALYGLLAVVLGVPIILAAGWNGVILIGVVSASLLLFLHWLETRRF